MFVQTNNKELIYNEFKNFQITESYLDNIWDNTNIRIYLYLLNNIKNIIKERLFLNQSEWKFYISKLHFCKSLLKNLNIDESYKKILFNNLREEFKYFEI